MPNGLNARIEAIPFDFTRLLSADDDVIFASGSLAEGFGNASSDLDLFVIQSSPWDNLTQPMFPLVKIIESSSNRYYIDVEIHSLESIRSIASNINHVNIDDASEIITLAISDLDLYYRVCIGQVVHNRDGFIALREEFDKVRSAEVLRQLAQIKSIGAWRVALGHRALGLSGGLVVSVRQATEWGIDCFLAGQNEAFPSLKWRFDKLERLLGVDHPYYAKAWKLKASGMRTVADYYQECFEFCLDLKVIPPGTLEAPPRLRRARDTVLVAVGEESFLVRNSRDMYKVDGAVRELWDLLGASLQLEQVVDEAARLPGVRRARLGRDGVTEMLRALDRRDLIDWL